MTKRKNLTNKQLSYIFIAIMLVLPILHLCTFVLYVDVSTIFYSFQDELTGKFTLQYFSDVLASISDTSSGDSLFVAFQNTLRYFFAGVAIIPVSLLLTYFLFKRIKGHNLFRTIVLLPSIIPALIWVTAYKEITSINGLLGQFMKLIGKPMEYSIFKNPDTANTALVIYNIWLGLAGGMLYYYSAMSRIPDSVFEAALLEGCSPIREAFQIVFPLIAPTIGTMLLLSISGFIGASGQILLFTKGANGTSTLSFFIYYKVLQDPTGGVGMVSALGILMTAVALPITLLARYVINKYLPDIEY